MCLWTNFLVYLRSFLASLPSQFLHRADTPEISTKILFFYHHEISQLSSRESRKSRRRRVASPALVGFAECFQPDGTRKR